MKIAASRCDLCGIVEAHPQSWVDITAFSQPLQLERLPRDPRSREVCPSCSKQVKNVLILLGTKFSSGQELGREWIHVS